MTTLQQLRTSVRAQRAFSVGIPLIIAVILIVFSVFPVLWMLSASLNPTGSLATQTLIPANAGLENYRELLSSAEFPFWRWFGNSIKIATITSVLSLSITTVAAYAFSRFRFRGRVTMLKKAEGKQNALRSFSWANEVEKVHAALYEKALKSLSKDAPAVDYYVCQACGYTVEDHAPDECPVCKAKKAAFRKAE